MYKFWLPDFFRTLIIALAISVSGSQAVANEETQHVASNFTLKNLKGKEVSLSQFRGKYLLINFCDNKLYMNNVSELFNFSITYQMSNKCLFLMILFRNKSCELKFF